MKRLMLLLGAVLSLGLACSKDSTAVDPDAIDGPEFAAVRATLDSALKDDSSYQIMRLFVFAYVDRASRIPLGSGPGDTLRVVGVQLDVNVMHADTPLVAPLSAVLAWRGYSPATHTVDTVTFVIGTGLVPPVNDSLREHFSPDTAGTGSGFVMHMAADSQVTAWLARAGALHISGSSFGGATTSTFGSLTLAVSRGTIAGDYHITAKQVPDSATTVGTAATFPTGVRAIKVKVTGSF